MTAQLPLLLAVGFAPVAVMLLLVIVTRLESSHPRPAGRDGGRTPPVA